MSLCDRCVHMGVCEFISNGGSDEVENCRHYEEDRPHDKWEYLKEHITEMRDADGELNQKQTCKFILELMGVIEREGETSAKDADNRKSS